MDSFWDEFLQDARPFENCVFVTREGQRYSTHKVLAARLGFLQVLLSRAEPEEDSLLLLPDYSQEEVEEAMQCALSQTAPENKERRAKKFLNFFQRLSDTFLKNC